MKHSLPKYPYTKIASSDDDIQQHSGASPVPHRPWRDEVSDSDMAMDGVRMAAARWAGASGSCSAAAPQSATRSAVARIDDLAGNAKAPRQNCAATQLMMLRALRSALTPARLAAPSAFRIAPPLARSATTTSRNYAALATSTSKADALLLKVSGRDSMGITAKFTEMLADAGCQFYDIDQPWCQPWCTNNLSLYFLVSMPDGTTEGSFIRSVLDRSRREDLHIEFEVVSRDDLAAAHADRAPQGLVVTLLSQELGFKEIAAVARTATDTGFNISKIRRLSTLQHEGGAGAAPVPGSTSWCERTGSPAPNITAVEFLVDPAVALTDSKASERRVQLRESLMELRQALQCDVALQRETLLRRSKRLVVLDMDSTIIQQEVIDELARRAGKYDEVSAVTEAAMRGEMDFDESLRQRCEHLKGLPDSVFGTVYRESIDLTPGADRFVQVTGGHGHHHSLLHHHHLRLTSSTIASFRCCKSSGFRWRSSPEGSRTSPTW